MTRGLLLNNPGNLRISNIPWKGKITPSSDPEFEQFDSMENGVRAMTKNLLTYFDKYTLHNIRKIIYRYAPPSENNTDAYIIDVCRRMEVTAMQEIDLHQESTLVSLVMAVISHEQGSLEIPLETIQAGVRRALY